MQGFPLSVKPGSGSRERAIERGELCIFYLRFFNFKFMKFNLDQVFDSNLITYGDEVEPTNINLTRDQLISIWKIMGKISKS